MYNNSFHLCQPLSNVINNFWSSKCLSRNCRPVEALLRKWYMPSQISSPSHCANWYRNNQHCHVSRERRKHRGSSLSILIMHKLTIWIQHCDYDYDYYFALLNILWWGGGEGIKILFQLFRSSIGALYCKDFWLLMLLSIILSRFSIMIEFSYGHTIQVT